MEIAKITSKGQLTIPKEIRKALGLKMGDKVVFMKNDEGNFVLMKDIALESKLPNLSSISASLALEDLNTTDEMLSYAQKRMNGQATYEGRVAEITARYQNGR